MVRRRGRSLEGVKRERSLDSQSMTTIKNHSTDSANSISTDDQQVCGREGGMLANRWIGILRSQAHTDSRYNRNR
jgi:hypothetical protein